MLTRCDNHRYSPRCRPAVAALLWVMVAAGLVRIVGISAESLQAAGSGHSVTADAVATRRCVQLVAVGAQALLALHGFAAGAVCSDALGDSTRDAGPASAFAE